MKIILPILLIFILSSCSLTKTSRLLNKGEITNSNYSEVFDFRYVGNLILIDIQIENQTYTCVLDTGAEISLFDQALMADIKHKVVAKKNVSGAAGIKNKFTFIEIPEVAFGNIQYHSLIALTSDLSSITDLFKCDEAIHGIIGNNFMRKANWRIDYLKQKVWISDHLSSFEALENNTTVKLKGNNVGSIYLPTSLDGIKGSYTFDTGNSGKLQSNASTFQKLLKANKELQYTQVEGRVGVTLNGIQYGKTNFTLIRELKIGELLLSNQIVELEENKNASSLVGNKILENFIITIDWKNKELHFSPNQKIKSDSLFEFQYTILNDTSTNYLRLRNKWVHHPTKLDLSENIKISHIEGIEVLNLGDEDYCDFTKNIFPKIKDQEEIKLTVVQDGSSENVILKKERLLPK